MSKKPTKLQRSQNAHRGLQRKAEHIPGIRGGILRSYHLDIQQKQERSRRILTKKERREVFSFYTRLFTPAKKSSNSSKKRSYLSDDFIYTSSGRIKGSYTPDGFFEPD